MAWLTRRKFLANIAGSSAVIAMTAGYGLAIEPNRLRFPKYSLRPAGWPAGLRLKVAVVADVHACRPWMTSDEIADVVSATNAKTPDIILLLGDYTTSHRFTGDPEPKAAWAGALARLKAPLGVHAVLGNHDWWEDHAVQRGKAGPPAVGVALEAAGIPLYENHAIRLEKDGHGFWLAGLGDQWAYYRGRRHRRGNGRFGYRGVDDIETTLAGVTDQAPVILMAHEPDIFARKLERVALTVSGHTHGGQVQMFGFAPFVPSVYGSRYLYGHIREEGRDLIVSGGLGCSGLPVRFGRPPEVPIIELGLT